MMGHRCHDHCVRPRIAGSVDGNVRALLIQIRDAGAYEVLCIFMCIF